MTGQNDQGKRERADYSGPVDPGFDYEDLQPEPPESQRPAAEHAVKYCPTHAPSIEED
jgi:ferredoxin